MLRGVKTADSKNVINIGCVEGYMKMLRSTLVLNSV